MMENYSWKLHSAPKNLDRTHLKLGDIKLVSGLDPVLMGSEGVMVCCR
jgi:hypothetical protein